MKIFLNYFSRKTTSRKWLKNSKTPAQNPLMMLPIVSKEFTGFLAVFSPREEPKESEVNFLNLFARQIELAITIANLFETVKKQAVTDPFNRII